MPIQPVKYLKSLYYANRPLEAKLDKSLVELPIELEDDIYNKIAKNYKKMDYVSKTINTPMKFARKGNKSTLMNFGPYTYYINNYAKAEEVNKAIDDIIQKTYAVKNINK